MVYDVYTNLIIQRWVLGSETVDELYKYRNLGVSSQNYVGSFSSNVIDNTEKTQKKVGMQI